MERDTIVALPLTAAMTTAMRRYVAFLRGVLLSLAIVLGIGGLVWTFFFDRKNGFSVGDWLFIIGLIGAFEGCLLFGLRRSTRLASAKIGHGQFLRQTGMISGRIVEGPYYYLAVNGREYRTNSAHVIEKITTPVWGTVDMSAKGMVIFEVRDMDGRVVCRDRKYRP